MKKIAIITFAILSITIVGIFFIANRYLGEEPTKEKTKVGILYNGQIDDKGWGQSHYEGISESAKVLEFDVL